MTYAIMRSTRLSHQKGRLVADQVRGMQVGKALDLLTFSTKKGAKLIKQVLDSAIANAEHNDGADIDELYVTKILVERGMKLRRSRARAKGRGAIIEKNTCNIRVEVGEKPAGK